MTLFVFQGEIYFIVEELRLPHPPPPIPAMARAAMSASIDGARPQSIVPEPRTKYKTGLLKSYRMHTKQRQGQKHGTFPTEDVG